MLVDQIDVVIRAINGIPIADRDASTGPSLRRSDVIRLELAPPGGEVRERPPLVHDGQQRVENDQP